MYMHVATYSQDEHSTLALSVLMEKKNTSETEMSVNLFSSTMCVVPVNKYPLLNHTQY